MCKTFSKKFTHLRHGILYANSPFSNKLQTSIKNIPMHFRPELQTQKKGRPPVDLNSEPSDVTLPCGKRHIWWNRCSTSWSLPDRRRTLWSRSSSWCIQRNSGCTRQRQPLLLRPSCSSCRKRQRQALLP